MKDEIRLLQDEVSVLKNELADLTKTVNELLHLNKLVNLTKTVSELHDLVEKNAQAEQKAEPYDPEPKIKFGNVSGDAAEWRRVMSEQLIEQGYSPEEVERLLTKIDREITDELKEDPEKLKALDGFRTEVTEMQRKFMQRCGSRFGVLVNTVEIKEPGKYFIWGVLDNDEKFLSCDPMSMAKAFSVFSNEQRLLLLKALYENAELTAAELQEITGLAPGGQFYHHLRELASIGLLAKSKRGSYALGATARTIVGTLLAIGNNLTSSTDNDMALAFNMLHGMSRLDPEELD